MTTEQRQPPPRARDIAFAFVLSLLLVVGVAAACGLTCRTYDIARGAR